MRGMNRDSDNTSDSNHFDPCHSDGIPGGCSSCEHRDECIQPDTDDEFLRDPMEPHPGDEFLVIDDGEQLTLFNVNDYLNDETEEEEDFIGAWAPLFEAQTVIVHLNNDPVGEELSIMDFMIAYDCHSAAFVSLFSKFIMSREPVPIPLNYDGIDYLFDRHNFQFRVATPEFWEQVHAGKWDDEDFDDCDEQCNCVDMAKSFVHLDGDAGPNRIPLQEYLDDFAAFIRTQTVRDMVDNFEVLVDVEEEFSVGYIAGTMYLATPSQMATLRETAEFMHSLECDGTLETEDDE